MRILFFNWRDIRNPAGGGAEIYIHEIAKRLVQKGHHVSFFTAGFIGFKQKEIIDGIHIFRKGNRYTVYWQAERFYKKNFADFDVVIDSINTVPFMSYRFVKKNTRLIAIIYQLAKEFWFYETPFPINRIGYYFLEPYWLKKYTNAEVLTISDSSMQDLLDLGYNNVRIVPVGLNIKPLSEVPQKEDILTLIFVGRMGHAKCPDHVIKAFSYIKKVLPETRLWMVGDGAMKKQLEKHKIPNVTFFGYIDNAKKHKLMSRAHLILVPGVREGWGMIVTEANARGTVAVGYNINGLKDSIQDGKTGLLCEPNPQAMADKAILLLKDNDLMKRFGDNSLRWAKQFTWDTSADKFDEILKTEV